MKKVVLCGSTKFKKEFDDINKQLSICGNVVYSVPFYSHADNIVISDHHKKILDQVHKRKIDLSDVVFVIDVDGYIGESTRKEIDYAYLTGKSIVYYSTIKYTINIKEYNILFNSHELK